MAEYVAPELPPLPPAPPPLPATGYTTEEWNRAWSYADLAQRRAELLSVDRERWSLQQHRPALEKHWADCNPQAAAAAFAPTVDRLADVLDALDARLGQLASALGYKPPTTPPAPPWQVPT